ncbi:MAG: AMP-binding protein [Acidimicrobiaceae bacterium]|nr:AMP-binding protein [Acidimicrobiaceae bacterium]
MTAALPHGNFASALWSVTAQHQSAPFLIEPGAKTSSYGQIDDLAARYAETLKTHGAEVGDRVLVQVCKSVEAVALYLACLRAGTVHVPLNPAFTPAELDYFLSDADPSVVVLDPSSAAARTATGGRPRILTLGPRGEGTLTEQADTPEIRAVRAVAAPIVERRDDDVAALLYTSGTTGRPKGAALSNANLRHNAVALHHAWHFSRSDRLLHCLPIFHTHGLFVALHCAMLSAIPVTFPAKFDSDQVLDSLRSTTVMMGVPTHYSRLLESPRLNAELAGGIRLFTCGSAPLRDSVFEEFSERTGHRICERYGMSETGIIASNPYNGERLAGTVGYPLPGVELRVVDVVGNDPAPLEPGTIGSVEVRGTNVFSGYWNQDNMAADNALSDDRWFTTGDLGSLDESGRLTLHGRSGDLIISGGENIYPKEVELVLDEVVGVRESAVVGVPDRDLGEAVIAVIVVDDERSALDNCKAELAARLSRHKHPKQILTAPSLPRNAMGKVQKNVLREQHSQHEQHQEISR